MASDVYANRMGWPSVVAVTAPSLPLAGLGLTHPNDLSGGVGRVVDESAHHSGSAVPAARVSHWVLLHGRPGVIAWIGRVAAFCTRADAQRHASEPSSSNRKLHSRDAIAA